MAAYTGNACGPYAQIAGACNDDAHSGSVCDGSNASLIAAPLTASETACIQVTCFDGISVGTFPFNVRLANSDATMPRIAAVSTSQGPPEGGALEP